MKKFLMVLMSLSILSVGTVQAATSSTPVSDWINSKTSAINKAENDAAMKAEARKKEAAAKQAQRDKELKAKQAEAKKRQAQRKKNVETKKQQFKDLFDVK